jgi:glycosyltransferase involved in cell wall biosynthesis
MTEQGLTISVIIPSYNHAQYLARAVHSVLNQEWETPTPELELIVVDDGSQDESLQVLAGIRDSRLRVISQENQGAHAAINRGLNEAKGDILAILNSDDEYHPQRLQKILAALEKAFPGRPQDFPGLAASYIELIDADGHTLGIKHGYLDQPPWNLEFPERSFRNGNDLNAALLAENYLGTTSNFVFTRAGCQAAADTVLPGEFQPLRYMHDWDFALRLTHNTPITLLPEPLLRYRFHQQNTIRQDQAAMVFELCWILAVHLPTAAGPKQTNESGYLHSDALRPHTQDRFLDRLLHSIYTYQCDRVLVVMLAHGLHADTNRALALLEPSNPERLVYLEYIQNQLSKPEIVDANAITTSRLLLNRFRRRWNILKARLPR